MKRYYVDVSGLDVNKKQEVYQLLDDYSYFTEIVQNNNNLEAIIVNWSSPNDFEGSPIFPKGCPCTLLTLLDIFCTCYL